MGVQRVPEEVGRTANNIFQCVLYILHMGGGIDRGARVMGGLLEGEKWF